MSETSAILSGEHFLLGDHAITEGALAAGCRFFAGYPITPSTETAERMSQRLPEVGGIYLQMEDEIASIAAILGAAWGGKKTMTATSGPGFSLMLENLGLGIITETPTVIVNVQRGAPSTGLPTLVAQGDMMQARWGSHGDYGVIALCPNSPQECFDLTIEAFNLSEEFRVPVMLMLDECVGHMTEKVVIPKPDDLEITPRRYTKLPPGEFHTYEPREDQVPDMVRAGDGYRFHVTGLTHDERGYPNMTVDTHDRMNRRLLDKLKPLGNGRALVEMENLADAEVVVVSYGITSRVAQRALQMARAKGIRAGKFRLISAWPFPEAHIADLACAVKAFVVPEINLGQMVHEVSRAAGGRAKVIPVSHAGGGVHNPDAILNAIEEAVR